ncbi:MAG: hypothetical protein E7311_05490 [Clostridiales bacterium]|nr:hypothetical protein [Clostridiales bacterium]
MFRLKGIKRKICLSVIICGILLSLSFVIYSMEDIEEVKFNGIVNTELLNLRQGPGTNYPVVGSLSYGETIRVIGKMNDWYIVQTSQDIIGLCNVNYIINSEEYELNKTVLDLINKYRVDNDLKELELDNNLSELAKKKAQDMIDNNYFDHISPSLGDPFEMMKNAEIIYKTAGENIAGYKNIEGAVEAWMNSESHKNNILSNGYNYTGIGIVQSEQYGYIIVQLFIGK